MAEQQPTKFPLTEAVQQSALGFEKVSQLADEALKHLEQGGIVWPEVNGKLLIALQRYLERTKKSGKLHKIIRKEISQDNALQYCKALSYKRQEVL